ncbi:MAG: DUF2085 domain-containing protein [Candidatus ainarchaeum sp.]|nr:DUF2085 domain-containing protein [Candidatus ainarchaeum sp.]
MKNDFLGYWIYLGIMGIIAIPAVTAPFVFYDNDEVFSQIHEIYHNFCHQVTSRSYCFFPETGTIENCFLNEEFSPSKQIVVEKNGIPGYKFPVCARDFGFYLFAFLGGIFLFTLGMHREINTPHPLWIILAIIPMGLDGGTQFIGLRESNNILRVMTGSIAGFVIPFYLVPMLNRIVIILKNKK